MTSRKKPILLGLVLALVAIPALAVVVAVGTGDKTVGNTRIVWDSSFQDLSYTLGDTVNLTVNWTVMSGAATYDRFEFKKVTPRPRKDPAQGAMLSATQSGNSVTVQFKFTDMHLDKRRSVDIGNAHLKLYLWVDTDGNGLTDTLVGYGVNLHAEDPQ